MYLPKLNRAKALALLGIQDDHAPILSATCPLCRQPQLTIHHDILADQPWAVCAHCRAAGSLIWLCASVWDCDTETTLHRLAAAKALRLPTSGKLTQALAGGDLRWLQADRSLQTAWQIAQTQLGHGKLFSVLLQDAGLAPRGQSPHMWPLAQEFLGTSSRATFRNADGHSSLNRRLCRERQLLVFAAHTCPGRPASVLGITQTAPAQPQLLVQLLHHRQQLVTGLVCFAAAQAAYNQDSPLLVVPAITAIRWQLQHLYDHPYLLPVVGFIDSATYVFPQGRRPAWLPLATTAQLRRLLPGRTFSVGTAEASPNVKAMCAAAKCRCFISPTFSPHNSQPIRDLENYVHRFLNQPPKPRTNKNPELQRWTLENGQVLSETTKDWRLRDRQGQVKVIANFRLFLDTVYHKGARRQVAGRLWLGTAQYAFTATFPEQLPRPVAWLKQACPEAANELQCKGRDLLRILHAIQTSRPPAQQVLEGELGTLLPLPADKAGWQLSEYQAVDGSFLAGARASDYGRQQVGLGLPSFSQLRTQLPRELFIESPENNLGWALLLWVLAGLLPASSQRRNRSYPHTLTCDLAGRAVCLSGARALGMAHWPASSHWPVVNDTTCLDTLLACQELPQRQLQFWPLAPAIWSAMRPAVTFLHVPSASYEQQIPAAFGQLLVLLLRDLSQYRKAEIAGTSVDNAYAVLRRQHGDIPALLAGYTYLQPRAAIPGLVCQTIRQKLRAALTNNQGQADCPPLTLLTKDMQHAPQHWLTLLAKAFRRLELRPERGHNTLRQKSILKLLQYASSNSHEGVVGQIKASCSRVNGG